MIYPRTIFNFIDGKMCGASSGTTFEKKNPDSGEVISFVARSGAKDVALAISSAKKAQKEWAGLTSVTRGDLMRDIALRMMERKQEISEIVAGETGRATAHVLGETQAAIEMGMFIAGEGRRNYGKTTTATMANRQVYTVRQPIGIAALVIASNTPIANVAWKAFPSMFCGNASIMKPSEDTPGSAWIFAEICNQVGIPPGVFNVVQGLGAEAGYPLVKSPDVDLVSFTGGYKTGAKIQEVAGARLAKVCMELGGKNALVVCDDADLGNAINWVLQSAFSNAGQRCAAASRIVVFDSIYDEFKQKLITDTAKLAIGASESDFLGPVVNERNLLNMIAAVEEAAANGAIILVGGKRMVDERHIKGFYMTPTIIEEVSPNAPISQTELFGPVTILYKVKDLDEAIDVVNNSSFALTSAIHTASLHRAMKFADKVVAGVIVVNGGTHGSEPHMGFGGLKNSGTGWREAGIEALDVYSDWKYVNLITHPDKA